MRSLRAFQIPISKSTEIPFTAEKVTPVFSLPCLASGKESACFPSTFHTIFQGKQTHPKQAFISELHLSFISVASKCHLACNTEYKKAHLKLFTKHSQQLFCCCTELLRLRSIPSLRFVRTRL